MHGLFHDPMKKSCTREDPPPPSGRIEWASFTIWEAVFEACDTLAHFVKDEKNNWNRLAVLYPRMDRSVLTSWFKSCVILSRSAPTG